MAQVIWTQTALSDLKIIVSYIALDKPQAAKSFAKKIIETIEKLADFPKLGKTSTVLESQMFRELIIPPCRVFYRIQQDIIYIVAVMRNEQE